MAITVILNIESAHLLEMLEMIDYIQSKSSQGYKAFTITNTDCVTVVN